MIMQSFQYLCYWIHVLLGNDFADLNLIFSPKKQNLLFLLLRVCSQFGCNKSVSQNAQYYEFFPPLLDQLISWSSAIANLINDKVLLAI